MKRINLLPPEQRAKASRERGLMYVIVGLVAVVVVLGLVYFQQSSTKGDLQDELLGLQAQRQAVEAQAAALQPYADIEAARTAMTETATQISESRVSWSSIYEQISLVIPDNVRLQSLQCTVPASMLPGAKGAAAEAAATTDVTLTGITYTPKDVAEFMTRLGLIPQLTDIQLASSTRVAATGTATDTTTVSPSSYRWQFTISASLRAHATAPPITTLTGVAE